MQPLALAGTAGQIKITPAGGGRLRAGFDNSFTDQIASLEAILSSLRSQLAQVAATRTSTSSSQASTLSAAQFAVLANAWYATVYPPTGTTFFYCSDTGLWHQVSLTGPTGLETWAIDETGTQFPPPTALHAFLSYQYPCPDTGKWHTVKLSGTPPTWEIDDTGSALPEANLDLAFSTKPVYNPDTGLYVTVGLGGVPPTWTYA